jgi:hypothetical protein
MALATPAKRRRKMRLDPTHARDLAKTIALVTAMARSLDSGETLSDAQIIAGRHDRTLGIFWSRAWDYAAYRSTLGRIVPMAQDNSTSIAIDRDTARCGAQLRARLRDRTPFTAYDDTYRQALIDGGLDPDR